MHERVREAPLSYLYPYSYGRSITAPVVALVRVNCVELEWMLSSALVVSGRPRELYGETEVVSALISV